MSSIILHADSNSFYANCERIFRPDLTGKPVVVLSNNDGIIIALTKEAKSLGFRRGDPYFKVKARCNAQNVAVFSSNYTLYADISRRITSIYLDFAPDIEQYSIDESFLFFPNFSLNEIREISTELRQRVLRETGMPICVGAGPTKTIAKWYNKHAKEHNGVFVYDPVMFDEGLKETDVADIWGIGVKKSQKLHETGIHNGFQLKTMNLEKARKMLTITGYATVMELNGVQAIDKVCRIKKDIITSSRQFGTRVYDLETLTCALTQYVENAVEKMRLQQSETGIVNIYLSTCYSFDKDENATIPYANWASVKLPYRTSYTPDILQGALQCLKKIYREGFGYKTVMVNLMDLADVNLQQELFRNNELAEGKRKIMAQMESMNEKYGRNTIRLTSSLTASGWEMQRNNLSPCYTTRLSDIPEVY